MKTRVIRLRPPAAPVGLTDVEKSNDPISISAELVDLSRHSPVEYPITKPRASSIQSACMRMHVLGVKKERSRTERDSLQSRMTFGLGNAWHWWVQNTPAVFGDRRRGWWRCTACGKVRYFGAPPRKLCEHCGARKEATVYHEHSIDLDSPYQVTGHPDMFIERHPGVFRFCELKSLAANEFLKLYSPSAEHEWQLMTYMWASEFDTRIPVDVDRNVGYIMYLSKGVQTTMLPVKTFVVIRNDDMIRRITRKLATYSEGIRNFPKSIPTPIDECVRGNFTNYRAKFCPVLKECMRYADGEVNRD